MCFPTLPALSAEFILPFSYVHNGKNNVLHLNVSVYVVCKGKWGAKPLDSNGNLSWCKYSPACQGVGPCLLGIILKQLIASFVMKHYKFWVQILYLIFPFCFVICVQVELLTILRKSILKEHKALEIKKAQNRRYWGMVAFLFRDMEILLFTLAQKFRINWFLMCTLSWLKF